MNFIGRGGLYCGMELEWNQHQSSLFISTWVPWGLAAVGKLKLVSKLKVISAKTLASLTWCIKRIGLERRHPPYWKYFAPLTRRSITYQIKWNRAIPKGPENNLLGSHFYFCDLWPFSFIYNNQTTFCSTLIIFWLT